VGTVLVASVLLLNLGAPRSADASEGARSMTVTIAPAARGRQVVRVSLPMPRGLLREGEGLLAADGGRRTVAGTRVLTWHPRSEGEPRSARRALLTLPYSFRTAAPVTFELRPRPSRPARRKPWAPTVSIGPSLDRGWVGLPDGRRLSFRVIMPDPAEDQPVSEEDVEANEHFLWQTFCKPDPQWTRALELRADSLRTIVLVAHLQHNRPGHGYAPTFGWELETQASAGDCLRTDHDMPLGAEPATHSFAEGKPCELVFAGGKLRLYHPAATLKLGGMVEARHTDDGKLVYRYVCWSADQKVPMQQAAWRRAEVVIAPVGLAPLRPTLEYAHQAKVAPALFDELYGTGEPLDLSAQPKLAEALAYHRDAIVRSMAHGADWGNVTGYSDAAQAGGVFGMNRLNHCPPIFEEGYRSGDRRLIDVGVLWCDNMYDQSVWWGPEQTGGTRYNNLRAMGQTPPDNDTSYMWRSLSSVNFCTKGYDSFLVAYEETGDPRMREALEAQVAYAKQYIHADQGEARNVGDVRDFVRLYRYTGERQYLDEALRLFRELRTRLSPGDLFSQSGAPIVPDPPFINDDEVGYKHPFAKPYIIGYALSGLPELAQYAPDEPKLRDVIQAVADFLADSQDPLGGWRYPHPRSSQLILSQAMEHAWQLVQADRFLGLQERHLDAIERVLRQRIHGWLKTGKCLEGLSPWEVATGKVRSGAELYDLYARPEDRDVSRDYAEGSIGLGSSPPEGLVYFPEVLAYYLEHRPASRLLAEPEPDEPLGIVLARLKG
jgi:hypothetical protein